MMIVKKLLGFFKRLFTSDKFPERGAGKMDKKVKDVYNVKVMDSEVDDKKVVVLDPRKPMNKESE